MAQEAAEGLPALPGADVDLEQIPRPVCKMLPDASIVSRPGISKAVLVEALGAVYTPTDFLGKGVFVHSPEVEMDSARLQPIAQVSGRVDEPGSRILAVQFVKPLGELAPAVKSFVKGGRL